jgi:hypothetical protein
MGEFTLAAASVKSKIEIYIVKRYNKVNGSAAVIGGRYGKPNATWGRRPSDARNDSSGLCIRCSDLYRVRGLYLVTLSRRLARRSASMPS